MEKYHRNEISPVEKENERDENYKASNPQIDSSRTKNNYHIIKGEDSYNQFINKRINQLNLPQKPRKDAVLMASFVIGSDGKFFDGLSQEEQQRFFADCTWYFAHKYGKNNIISAVVHMDETTPHLHLNLMPVKDGRLCAKNLFNRQNLTMLQTDFHEAVGKKYGLLRGKEGSQASHLSTAEFKATKIVDAANNRAEEITHEARSSLQDISNAVSKAETHFDETVKQIQTAKTERDKIIADRNAEADYSKALSDAKNGEISRGKNGLREQVITLVTENKRLEQENLRLKRDNKDLFDRHKGFETSSDKYSIAIKAISLFRSSEPEAFARVFYQATSILQPFVAAGESVANVKPDRLRQIEEEIRKEKKQDVSATKETNYK